MALWTSLTEETIFTVFNDAETGEGRVEGMSMAVPFVLIVADTTEHFLAEEGDSTLEKLHVVSSRTDFLGLLMLVVTVSCEDTEDLKTDTIFNSNSSNDAAIRKIMIDNFEVEQSNFM